MRWLSDVAYWLGLTNANGHGYLFWSGGGGYFFAGAVYVRHHNCHVPWCWRRGKHPLGLYMLCSKHHPEVEG